MIQHEIRADIETDQIPLCITQTDTQTWDLWQYKRTLPNLIRLHIIWTRPNSVQLCVMVIKNWMYLWLFLLRSGTWSLFCKLWVTSLDIQVSSPVCLSTKPFKIFVTKLITISKCKHWECFELSITFPNIFHGNKWIVLTHKIKPIATLLENKTSYLKKSINANSHLTSVASLQIQCRYIQRNPAMIWQALIQKQRLQDAVDTQPHHWTRTLIYTFPTMLQNPLRYIQIFYIQWQTLQNSQLIQYVCMATMVW